MNSLEFYWQNYLRHQRYFASNAAAWYNELAQRVDFRYRFDAVEYYSQHQYQGLISGQLCHSNQVEVHLKNISLKSAKAHTKGLLKYRPGASNYLPYTTKLWSIDGRKIIISLSTWATFHSSKFEPQTLPKNEFLFILNRPGRLFFS